MNAVNAKHLEPSILLRRDEAGITTLTLNRPRQYNALSKALLTALQQALDAIGEDPTVRAWCSPVTGGMFYRQLEMTLEDAYAYASEIMANNLNSEDAREGIDAFIDKRDPHWRGR